MTIRNVSYLRSDWRITMNHLSTRLKEFEKNPWYYKLEHLINVKDILRKERNRLRIIQGLNRYRAIRNRIDKLLDQEDYVANKYGKYFLFKYEFNSVDKEVSLYGHFLEIPSTILNNKRRNKEMNSFILEHAWNIDENSKGEYHMHLFLYCDASWVSGNYSKDKEIYESKIRKLNEWIVKLVRNCKSEVSTCVINIINEKINMVNYLTDKEDYDARNDNRVWLCYLSKKANTFDDIITGYTRLFGHTKIKETHGETHS